MNKEYYKFEEIDNIELQVIEMLGVENVYNALVKWLGYDKLKGFLKDLCRDYDIKIDEGVEENDNNN